MGASSAESDAKCDEPERGQTDVETLITASLKQVPHYGWTRRSIDEAVSALGWSPAAGGMLSRGPVQLAEAFVNRCNVRLAKELADEHVAYSKEPLDERLKFAIKRRISMLEPFHYNWRHALALQALPRNAPHALRQSALMVDEIAHFGGLRTPQVSYPCSAK